MVVIYSELLIIKAAVMHVLMVEENKERIVSCTFVS